MRSNMKRREFLQVSSLAGAAAFLSPLFAAKALPAPPASRVKSFELDEITIAQLQAGMHSGKFSAGSLTKKYLARIAEIDKRGPALNAVIELNPDAIARARALDISGAVFVVHFVGFFIEHGQQQCSLPPSKIVQIPVLFHPPVL